MKLLNEKLYFPLRLSLAHKTAFGISRLAFVLLLMISRRRESPKWKFSTWISKRHTAAHTTKSANFFASTPPPNLRTVFFQVLPARSTPLNKMFVSTLKSGTGDTTPSSSFDVDSDDAETTSMSSQYTLELDPGILDTFLPLARVDDRDFLLAAKSSSGFGERGAGLLFLLYRDDEEAEDSLEDDEMSYEGGYDSDPASDDTPCFATRYFRGVVGDGSEGESEENELDEQTKVLFSRNQSWEHVWKPTTSDVRASPLFVRSQLDVSNLFRFYPLARFIRLGDHSNRISSAKSNPLSLKTPSMNLRSMSPLSRMISMLPLWRHLRTPHVSPFFSTLANVDGTHGIYRYPQRFSSSMTPHIIPHQLFLRIFQSRTNSRVWCYWCGGHGATPKTPIIEPGMILHSRLFGIVSTWCSNYLRYVFPCPLYGIP